MVQANNETGILPTFKCIYAANRKTISNPIAPIILVFLSRNKIDATASLIPNKYLMDSGCSKTLNFAMVLGLNNNRILKKSKSKPIK